MHRRSDRRRRGTSPDHARCARVGRLRQPGPDSTGNTFITYNPGRYNGVLVLIPTAGGFEDIGWDDTGGSTQHYYGKHAYYNAELLGPGPDGRGAISITVFPAVFISRSRLPGIGRRR